MLTLKDCIDFSDLSEDEICAIAEYEHIPLISALEEGECLVHSKGGCRQIATMILKQAKICERAGNATHARHLQNVHDKFIAQHDAGRTAM
ncbi:MAG: hypothetical protein ABID63_15685 [Pseudomonadota bacterium]